MGRAPCCSKVGLNRGPWTPEEDMLLSKYIEAHGEGNWRALPKAAGLLRCGKSCRLRWVNYLRPNVKRGNISEDEEDLIIMLHALLGNRWSLIAARMPGRTDNEIKNYWNTHLSKKLASRGLDPKTHKPINNNKSNSAKKTEESRDGDDHPQEAWETTMDFDTSSYSTGSCEDDVEQVRIQANLSSRLISKRGHTLPPVLKMTELKKKQGTSCAAKNRSGDVHEEQNVEKVMINQPNKFDCASPSSVLNIHSPAPSSSNSGSNCDSPGSSSQRIPSSSSEQSLNSFTSTVQIPEENREATTPAFMDWDQMQGQHQMLEFIDDFLCNKEDDHHVVGDLFKEDGGSEFWDTLGKIEMPMPQSDLWDGLNELMPNQQVGATPSQHFPQIGNSDNIQAQAAHLPLINPSHSLPSTPFLQDNISELLFCA